MFRSTIAAFIIVLATSIHADEHKPIAAALDRFVEECSASIASPSGYLADALAGGDNAPVAVAREEGEDVYMLVGHPEPTELYHHFAELGDASWVRCQVALFNDPSVADAALTNDAVLEWVQADETLTRVGGGLDLKSLMAGDASAVGQELEPVIQIYQHVVTGWTEGDIVASITAQAGMLEAVTWAVVPSPLSQ